MLFNKLLSALSSIAASYSDITIVTSGSALGRSTTGITFSPPLQQNDVVFLIVGSNDTDWTVPAGYIPFDKGILDINYKFDCYFKVMGATPDTEINLYDGNDSSGFVYYALRGVQTELPLIETASFCLYNDPAALNPLPVSVINKSLVLVGGFTGNGSQAEIAAPPTGYSGFLTIDAQGSQDTFVGAAYKQITENGIEDADSFSLNNSANGYGSFAASVRPYSDPFIPPLAPEVISHSVGVSANTVSPFTLTLPKPSNVQQHDLLLAYTMYGDSNGYAPPDEWNILLPARQDIDNPSLQIFFKFANNNEPSSYDFVFANYSGSGAAKNEGCGSIICCRSATIDALTPPMTSTGSLVPNLDLDDYYRLLLLSASTTSTRIFSNSLFNALYQSDGAVGVSGGVLQRYWPSRKTGELSAHINLSGLRQNCCALKYSTVIPPDILPKYIITGGVNSTASASSITLTIPSEKQLGDLLIAVVFTQSGYRSFTEPAGWNTATTIYTSGSFLVAYSIVTAATGNSVVFPISASSILSGCIVVYRDAVIDTLGTAVNGISANSINVTQNYGLALYLAGVQETLVDSSTGLNQRLLYNNTTYPSLAVYEKIMDTAGATGILKPVETTAGAINCTSLSLKPPIPPVFVAAIHSYDISDTLTINVPSGTQAGDLLVFIGGIGGSSGGWLKPLGWTEVIDQGTDPSLSFMYKVASSSEPTSYTFTTSGDSVMGLIATFRNTLYKNVSSVTSATSNSISSPIINTNYGALYAVVADGDGSTFSTPVGLTKVDEIGGLTATVALYFKDNARGDTSIETFSYDATATLASIQIGLTPA